MLKKVYFLISLALAFCFSVFVYSNTAQAQAVGVKISPTRFDDLVEPGEVLNVELKVTNNSNSGKKLFVYLRDFKAEGEEGKPKLLAPGTESGSYLASWLEISTEGTEFGPNEEKIIPMTIRVPSDVGPGGYYGAVLFGTEPPQLDVEGEERGAGMAVAQQTGSLIILQVKGDVEEEASIREFSTNKSIYGTPFSVDFLLRIDNAGNVHIKPRGAILIKNMFGNEVGEAKVNESNANVLPDSTRRFDVNWEGNFGFGRYTAELGLSYGTPTDLGGQGKQSLHREINFWIMPWRILLPGLLGLIFITSLFVLLLKLYRNKAVRKAMAQAGFGHVRMVKKYQGPSPVLHLGAILAVVVIFLFLILIAIYFILFA
jgi:hypothetical protein